MRRRPLRVTISGSFKQLNRNSILRNEQRVCRRVLSHVKQRALGDSLVLRSAWNENGEYYECLLSFHPDNRFRRGPTVISAEPYDSFQGEYYTVDDLRGFRETEWCGTKPVFGNVLAGSHWCRDWLGEISDLDGFHLQDSVHDPRCCTDGWCHCHGLRKNGTRPYCDSVTWAMFRSVVQTLNVHSQYCSILRISHISVCGVTCTN